MKYYIIAGEASGDLHGSNLITQLHQLDHAASIRCWGGEKMESAGASLVKHYRDLAFMGFAEVIKNLPTIFKNLHFCKKDILQFQPDVLVLIDYPGFNLRIAEWANQHGFKVVYYISPQVWAWKPKRVIKMKKHINLMLCILPFEKNYYQEEWNWQVSYVGHPLVEVINQSIELNPTVTVEKVIALLPGSRKQEIAVKLPIMLGVANAFPQYQFIVAEAPGLDSDFYQPFLSTYQNVSSIAGQTYSLLQKSTAALVTSGTATLETALFGVPEIVCYKGSPISYQIAKRLIKIKYISLVNLIMNKLVVTELIQDQLTTKNLIEELDNLLNNPARKTELANDYTLLKSKLSEGGFASKQAAEKIMEFLH